MEDELGGAQSVRENQLLAQDDFHGALRLANTHRINAKHCKLILDLGTLPTKRGLKAGEHAGLTLNVMDRIYMEAVHAVQ